MKGHDIFKVYFTKEANRLETLTDPAYKYHSRDVTSGTWNVHFQPERLEKEHNVRNPTLLRRLQYPIWVQIRNFSSEEQTKEVLREMYSQIAPVIAVDTNEAYRLRLSRSRFRKLVGDFRNLHNYYQTTRQLGLCGT